jgi:hypothetical protein
MDNPLINEMKDIHFTFKNMSQEEKIEIVKLKAELIKKFEND